MPPTCDAGRRGRRFGILAGGARDYIVERWEFRFDRWFELFGMDGETILECDVAIVGGGGAGMWLLDDLRRLNVRAVLIESRSLGDGQTSIAQGILHGGTRYALKGILSAAAKAVSAMPGEWRKRLAGDEEPDLRQVTIRTPWCYLWRNDSWKSWLGMQGAKAALQVQPVALDDAERPAPLQGCPGSVYRLDEPVIDPVSFLAVLRERSLGCVWKADEIGFKRGARGVDGIYVRTGSRSAVVRPSQVVLSAGAGNEQLRTEIGLARDAMQRRPLHVALVRGTLPALNGHCVDGAHTRVTITTHATPAGTSVWQLGGQVSEDGVRMERAEFLAHAQKELTAVLPGWRRPPVEWAALRVDRAEARTADRSRPDDVQLLSEGNVHTIWPTKLVFAPLAAERAIEALVRGAATAPAGAADSGRFAATLAEFAWPAPDVAVYPWDRELEWTRDG